MYFKTMKCFVYDFIVMVFVMATVGASMIYTDLIVVSFNASILTIALIIILFVYFIQLLNQVFFIGLRAICDLLFKNYTELKGVYVNQVNYRGSAFSEKNSSYIEGEGVKRIRRTYYKVIVDSCGKNISLTSSEYISLSQGERYAFTIGSTSRIIVGVDGKNL